MADTNLTIYLAHGDARHRKVIAANLELLHHHVVLSTASPAVLVRRCQERPPDIAIVGTRFDEEDCFDVLNRLSNEDVCTVIAILRHDDVGRSRRLLGNRIMGVLVEPVNHGDLRTAIYLARKRFAQSKEMQARIGQLKDELSEIERDERL